MDKIILAGFLGCGLALSATANTTEVPAGRTVKLENGTDYSATTFALSGGTLDQNGVTGTAGGLVFTGTGTSTLTNSGETATTSYAGDFTINEKGTEAAARGVHISGGRHVFPSGLFNLAEGSSDPVTFELSGEDTLLSVTRKSGTMYLADQGLLTMNIRGGRLELKGNYREYVASSQTSVFNLNISGGYFSASDVLDCQRGEINILVAGGTFAPAYLRMGCRGDIAGSKAHTLTITDGLLDVSDELSAPYEASTYSVCTVNLNGGVAKVPFIRAAATPYAASAFSANGGTLMPRADQSNLLSGFTTARLGERGLTVDTQTYETTIPQSFTGLAEGATYGRLAKRGAGTLTLTGAIADDIRVESLASTLNVDGTVAAAKLVAKGGRAQRQRHDGCGRTDRRQRNAERERYGRCRRHSDGQRRRAGH